MTPHPFEPDNTGRFCRVPLCGQTPSSPRHQQRVTRSRVVLTIDHDVAISTEEVTELVVKLLEHDPTCTLADVQTLR